MASFVMARFHCIHRVGRVPLTKHKLVATVDIYLCIYLNSVLSDSNTTALTPH
jgi:hypothetical protein